MAWNIGASLNALVAAIADARVRISAANGTLFPHVPITYVQLGDLSYELAGPVTGLDAQQEFTYAEHAVVQGKPRLQAIGDGLEELTLALEFHAERSDPDLEIAALRAMASAHAAVPLVRADGVTRGTYVITSVQETTTQTDAAGARIHATVRVTLKEWVADQVLEVQIKRPSVKRATTKKKAAPTVPADLPSDDVSLDELLRYTNRYEDSQGKITGAGGKAW